jgi:hypothetical protein
LTVVASASEYIASKITTVRLLEELDEARGLGGLGQLVLRIGRIDDGLAVRSKR